MGLLTAGKPLNWEDSLKFLSYVKDHGVEQFINIWLQYKDNRNDLPLWGDEIEYLLLHLPTSSSTSKTVGTDAAEGTVQLSLRSKQIQDDVLEFMSDFSAILSKTSSTPKAAVTDLEKCVVHPEYGSFMIETTPHAPYGVSGSDLIGVETNMLYRREWIESQLNTNERLLLLPSFPTLGEGQYCHPFSASNGDVAKSLYVTDAVINPHPRFATLTRNIRTRRGKNVDIRVPLFRDVETPQSDTDIHMDAMAFGMGCCCLQTTYQASDLSEACFLYDQLSCVTPMMMALTACTPFLRGKVSDLDCRWTVIAQSVDDRTAYEMKLSNDNNGDDSTQRIHKSRYSTIDSYLSRDTDFKSDYEDVELVMNKKYYDRLVSAGVEEQLARHVSHLFIRDPLAIYSDIIDVKDEESTYHFETLQSTNWNNMRFKPPPPKNENVHNIGWRVEFRSMEVQITEFENAAFSVFVLLLTRAILHYKLDFYVHISKSDQNFDAAHQRDAVNTQLFWWHTQPTASHGKDTSQITKMSIKDIMCGNDQNRGLIELVRSYLDEYANGKFYSDADKKQLQEYLDFLELRAKGEILTGAQWLRNFVLNHKLYKKDSKISGAMCREITDVLDDIVHGKRAVPELLGTKVDIAQRRRERIKLEIPKKSELRAILEAAEKAQKQQKHEKDIEQDKPMPPTGTKLSDLDSSASDAGLGHVQNTSLQQLSSFSTSSSGTASRSKKNSYTSSGSLQKVKERTGRRMNCCSRLFGYFR